jgi:hypothetical protein
MRYLQDSLMEPDIYTVSDFVECPIMGIKIIPYSLSTSLPAMRADGVNTQIKRRIDSLNNEA